VDEVSERTVEKSLAGGNGGENDERFTKTKLFLSDLFKMIFFFCTIKRGQYRLVHEFVRPVQTNAVETIESAEILTLIAVQPPVVFQKYKSKKGTTRESIKCPRKRYLKDQNVLF